MGRIPFNVVSFNDVYTAVELLTREGYDLGNMPLQKIREVMGDRGDLNSISKHLDRIKIRKDRGEDFDGTELTKTDIEDLCATVNAIVERRILVSRCEAAEHKRLVVDLISRHEAELETKAEIIEDLEGQMFALEGECGMLKMGVESLERQIAQFEGTVDALQQVIATLAPKPAEDSPSIGTLGRSNARDDVAPAAQVDQRSEDRAENGACERQDDQPGVVREEQD